jgi:hypothetical protein
MFVGLSPGAVPYLPGPDTVQVVDIVFPSTRSPCELRKPVARPGRPGSFSYLGMALPSQNPCHLRRPELCASESRMSSSHAWTIVSLMRSRSALLRLERLSSAAWLGPIRTHRPRRTPAKTGSAPARLRPQSVFGRPTAASQPTTSS